MLTKCFNATWLGFSSYFLGLCLWSRGLMQFFSLNSSVHQYCLIFGYQVVFFFPSVQIVLWLLIYKWAHLMWFEKKYYYCIFSTLTNEESITWWPSFLARMWLQTWQRLGNRKEIISKDNSEAYFLLGKRSHQCILTHTCIFSILSSYFCPYICPFICP